MQCPEKAVLNSFVLCDLSQGTYHEIEEHLAECSSCRQIVEELERQESRSGKFSVLSSDSNSLWTQVRQRAIEKLQTQESLPLPLTVKDYLLTEKIGEGGMGEVYLAEHQVLKRKLAIKFIRQKKLLNSEFVSQFLNEIQAAGKLIHPNIVSTTDASLYDGTPYLVMELLEGQILSDYVKANGGKLSFREARKIVLQIARGLHFAHNAGFVHCDIKPSNIWRMPDGTVKILDLGLARLREDLENETTHQIWGTPNFMAPEQRVPHAKIDVRADIYALGCVFFYLLTGLTQEDCVCRQISFPNAREAGTSIPPKAQRVLDQMTHQIASRRFSSMEPLSLTLQRSTHPSLKHGLLALGCILAILACGTVLTKDKIVEIPPLIPDEIPPSISEVSFEGLNSATLPVIRPPEEPAEGTKNPMEPAEGTGKPDKVQPPANPTTPEKKSWWNWGIQMANDAWHGTLQTLHIEKKEEKKETDTPSEKTKKNP